MFFAQNFGENMNFLRPIVIYATLEIDNFRRNKNLLILALNVILGK